MNDPKQDDRNVLLTSLPLPGDIWVQQWEVDGIGQTPTQVKGGGLEGAHLLSDDSNAGHPGRLLPLEGVHVLSSLWLDPSC